MSSRRGWKLSAVLMTVAFGASLSGCDCGEPCNPELDDECPFDAGPEPEDFCDSPMEALNDTANCVLPLACGVDAGRLAYINPPSDGGIDIDWYSASFGTLTARSLLRVYAGYNAPSTPVDLAVGVLNEQASMSLIRVVDNHGQGAPRPIDILMPYTQSNTKLLFLVSDRGGRPPQFDLRSKYFISVCTQENPDVNEPNDSPDAGTAIPLTPMGAIHRGMNTGYLATDNDVDRFKIDVPANTPAARNVLYVHVTAPALTAPPPPYRLSFTLYDPNGVPIAEQVTPNAFLAADLATAKLVRTPGQYTVVVQGYRANPNDMSVVQGDLRLQYTVDVQLMEDVDAQEPNDSMAEAMGRARMLGPGQSATVTGRLSYVPDPEFFAIDVPPNAGHSTMYVRLTQSQMSGRFAPLSGPKDRQMRIIAAVAGADLMTSINNCVNTSACPKGYASDDVGLRDLVASTCRAFADAGSGQCLWLERNQNNDSPAFADLRNMQGTIPIAPHTGTLRYWVIVQDEGNNWADDIDWTLNVSVEADPDEARFGPITGSIPGTVNGVLTHGYGRTFQYDLPECAARPQTDCDGIRSPYDYDAVPTDIDQFTYTLPGGMDQSWQLQWEIDKVDGGVVPADIILDLRMCGQTPDGGCGRGSTAFQTDNFQPWYGMALTDRVFGWTREDMGSFVRVTARLNQCLCFPSATTRLEMNVGVVDRDWYGPVTYRVTHGVGAFSGSFPGDGGMPATCGPQSDAGPIRCGNSPPAER